MANKTIEISIDELKMIACDNCTGCANDSMHNLFACKNAIKELYRYQDRYNARITIGGFLVLPNRNGYVKNAK
jgi:hypothetical protein